MLSTVFTCFAFLGFICSIQVDCNAWSLRPRWWLGKLGADPDLDVVSPTQWAQRQHFLLDLLLQVHKPMLNQELIEMGRELSANPSDYEEGSWPLLQDFFARVKEGRILGPSSLYSHLEEELPQQLLDVYLFLVLAKDWRTFQRNACYCRCRLNAVLFVHALQLALAARADTKDLMTPAMHEVLPQLYFNKEVILEAKSVNWQQLAPIHIYEKRSWRETLGNFLYTKVFGYPTLPDIMPADPIVIKDHSIGTQLSEEPSLNGFWSQLISRHIMATQAMEDYGPFIPDGDRMMAFRRSLEGSVYCNALQSEANALNAQSLIHNIMHFVALLRLEELANSQSTSSTDYATPSLMTTGGVAYKGTALDEHEIQKLVKQSFEVLQGEINKYRESHQELPSMWFVGELIVRQYWILCRHLSLAVNGNRVAPNLLGMTSSNLRDPIYRTLLVQLAQLISTSELPVQPLLHFRDSEGFSVQSIEVGKLETMEQVVDTDLVNLIDQQLLQSHHSNLQLLRRRLVVRHLRLNHKPFTIAFLVTAPYRTFALIRSYLVAPGEEQQRLLFASFVIELVAGDNRIERYFPTAVTAPTLSQIYEAQYPIEFSKLCAFPQNLLLPRGTDRGLELQLILEVHRWTKTQEQEECDCTGGVNVGSALVLARGSVHVSIYHHNLKISGMELG